MLIIFDGGPTAWPEIFAPSTYTKVIYVGHGKSADDYIKESLEIHKHENVVLVSSDRELNRFAAQRSIPSVEAHAFLHLVDDVFELKGSSERKINGKLHKITQGNNETLDELMSVLEPVIKKEEGDMKSPSKKKTLSKKERFLLEKLKKL